VRRSVPHPVLPARLWYRLSLGVYVSANWVYTATGQPVPGMSRC
jgi:hypothetical protein